MRHLIRRINQLLVAVGGVFLVAMAALTCANIVLRQVWLPVQGTFELMGFFGAVATAFALGQTQMHRGHIAVDVVVNGFSDRKKAFVQAANNLLCALFFGLVTWQVAEKAAVVGSTGELTETLRIAYHPFIYAVAVGFAVLCLVLLADLAAARKGGAR